MSAALRTFLWIVWHGDQFAGIFLRRTDVHQRLLRTALLLYLITEGSNGFIRPLRLIGCFLVRRDILDEGALLLLPFGATTVQNSHVLMAVILEQSQRVAREPVRFIAIENYCC